jgi:hypothetical protein
MPKSGFTSTDKFIVSSKIFIYMDLVSNKLRVAKISGTLPATAASQLVYPPELDRPAMKQ